MADRVRGVPPGILSLAALLDDHGEAIEADLLIHCRVDLLDLWRGGLSWRRLGVLIRHLPMESATKTAIRNATPISDLRQAQTGDYGPWSQTHMLLAELIDVARWLQWTKTKGAEKNTGHPKPYPRPGVKQGEEKAAVTADVIDLMERMRANRGGLPGYINTKTLSE